MSTRELLLSDDEEGTAVSTAAALAGNRTLRKESGHIIRVKHAKNPGAATARAFLQAVSDEEDCTPPTRSDTFATAAAAAATAGSTRSRSSSSAYSSYSSHNQDGNRNGNVNDIMPLQEPTNSITEKTEKGSRGDNSSSHCSSRFQSSLEQRLIANDIFLPTKEEAFRLYAELDSFKPHFFDAEYKQEDAPLNLIATDPAGMIDAAAGARAAGAVHHPLNEYLQNSNNNNNNNKNNYFNYNKKKGEEVVLNTTSTVNRYAARHLFDHQVSGVRWLWNKYCHSEGAILGDDMGMGKTVQIAALLLAIFHKTGLDEVDSVANMKKRKNPRSMSELEEVRNREEEEEEECVRQSVSTATTTTTATTAALPSSSSSSFPSFLPPTPPPPPALIVCPTTVLQNWKEELNRWGYFLWDGVDGSKSANLQSDTVLLKAKRRQIDVVLISYDQIKKFVDELSAITWSVVVYDEGHKLMNDKTTIYKNVMQIDKTGCKILLTGTPLQNSITELYNLLNIIRAMEGINSKDFNEHFAKPIKIGMSSLAQVPVQQVAAKRLKELQDILAHRILARSKLDHLVGKHRLPGKDEVMVLCDMSPLQKELYTYVLSLPDFDNTKYHALPCPCGSKAKRNECCDLFQRPCVRPPQLDGSSAAFSGPSADVRAVEMAKQATLAVRLKEKTIDSRAVIWRQFGNHHQGSSSHSPSKSKKKQRRSNTMGNDDDEGRYIEDENENENGNNNKNHACDRCPSCIALPCMSILSKIASHPYLLQYDGNVDFNEKQRKAKQFIEEALSPELRYQLGGSKRSTSFIEMSSTQHSGKMQVLVQMLTLFVGGMQKSLVFSQSTQTLDLIEAIVKAKGWQSFRLDGQTDKSKRQQMCHDFNSSSSSVYIFLLSSKAGGLGLNLTAASKVVIFDVCWNPTVDQQSQDRAFRVGQTERVSVFRLVSKGSIEEMAYMRQLYKQQLQTTVLQDHRSARQFEGVAGEHQGELFGVENLFMFNETGSFLKAIRDKYENKRRNDNNNNNNNNNYHHPHSASSVSTSTISSDQGNGGVIAKNSSSSSSSGTSTTTTAGTADWLKNSVDTRLVGSLLQSAAADPQVIHDILLPPSSPSLSPHIHNIIAGRDARGACVSAVDSSEEEYETKTGSGSGSSSSSNAVSAASAYPTRNNGSKCYAGAAGALNRLQQSTVAPLEIDSNAHSSSSSNSNISIGDNSGSVIAPVPVPVPTTGTGTVSAANKLSGSSKRPLFHLRRPSYMNSESSKKFVPASDAHGGTSSSSSASVDVDVILKSIGVDVAKSTVRNSAMLVGSQSSQQLQQPQQLLLLSQQLPSHQEEQQQEEEEVTEEDENILTVNDRRSETRNNSNSNSVVEKDTPKHNMCADGGEEEEEKRGEEEEEEEEEQEEEEEEDDEEEKCPQLNFCVLGGDSSSFELERSATSSISPPPPPPFPPFPPPARSIMEKGAQRERAVKEGEEKEEDDEHEDDETQELWINTATAAAVAAATTNDEYSGATAATKAIPSKFLVCSTGVEGGDANIKDVITKRLLNGSNSKKNSKSSSSSGSSSGSNKRQKGEEGTGSARKNLNAAATATTATTTATTAATTTATTATTAATTTTAAVAGAFPTGRGSGNPGTNCDNNNNNNNNNTTTTTTSATNNVGQCSEDRIGDVKEGSDDDDDNDEGSSRTANVYQQQEPAGRPSDRMSLADVILLQQQRRKLKLGPNELKRKKLL